VEQQAERPLHHDDLRERATTTKVGAFASAENGTSANRPKLTIEYVH